VAPGRDRAAVSIFSGFWWWERPTRRFIPAPRNFLWWRKIGKFGALGSGQLFRNVSLGESESVERAAAF